MIALALQIRILFLVLLVAAAAWLLWRLGQRLAARMAADPRLRGTLSGPGVRLLGLYLLRVGLPLLVRLLRGLRFFR